MITAVLVGWASAVVSQSGGSGGEVWGTYPAWVSAIGASAAFLLTFRLFLQGRQERIRRQADMVYATEELGDEKSGQPIKVTATVHNKSTAPIWDVEIHPRWNTESESVRGPEDQPLPFVEPETPASCWSWTIAGSDLTSRKPPVRIVFSDATGRRWEKVGSKAIRQTWLRRRARRARLRWLARRGR